MHDNVAGDVALCDATHRSLHLVKLWMLMVGQMMKGQIINEEVLVQATYVHVFHEEVHIEGTPAQCDGVVCEYVIIIPRYLAQMLRGQARSLFFIKYMQLLSMMTLQVVMEIQRLGKC